VAVVSAGGEAGRGRLAASVAAPQGNGSMPARRKGLMRRLYDWVLSWSESPYGALALFVLAFAESSFFPVPPDPLLLALALGLPGRALYFAFLCTAGSVVGGMAGYAIGWGIWAVVSDFFFQYIPGFTPEVFERVRLLYDRWDFWAVFVAGLTPIPYKVFTIAGGVFQISFPVFVLASALSRGLRFFIEAGLIFYFGPGIAGFIDKHFDHLAWLFLALLIGGFVLVSLV